MSTSRKIMCMALGLLGLCAAASAQSTTIAISQIYGGAGCTTSGCSTYKNDYIELFNKSASAISLNGWSVQYTSATGPTTSWAVTALPNVMIQPGQYFLVVEAFNTNGVNVLPAGVLAVGDATGTIAMSATAGKVALVSNITALTTSNPSGAAIVDLVGYGATANGFEGAPAPAPSTANAIFRANNGCIDTQQNGADFAPAPASPRTSSNQPYDCASNTPGACCDIAAQCSFGLQSACSVQSTFTPNSPCAPAPGGITCGTASGGACCASDGTCELRTQANCASSQVMNGQTCAAAGCPALVGQCCNADTGACSLNFEFSCPSGTTFLVNSLGTTCSSSPTCDKPTGACCAGNLAGSICEVKTLEQCTTGGLNAWFGKDTACSTGICAPPAVVISEVYGGGGSTTSAASYMQDYVELFNRSGASVDIAGWTLQYASAVGSTVWNKSTAIPALSSTGASSVIPNGGYYLIKLNQGSGTFMGADLLDADSSFVPTSSLQMSATVGKVALVRAPNALTGGSCPIGGAVVVDFVGYGTADCREGAAAAGTLSATTAAVRKVNGCQDTNQNADDFVVASGPTPRSHLSPINDCFSQPPGVTGSVNPDAICNGSTARITVTTTPGTGPVSSEYHVTADLTNIGVANTAATFTHDAGNNYYLDIMPVSGLGLQNITVSVTDQDSNRHGETIIAVTISDCPPPSQPSTVVISQIYGGGGNGGSLYDHDFVELFNRSASPVNISDWSLQYASTTDDPLNSGPFGSGYSVGVAPNVSVNNVVIFAPNTIIPAGGYFLIQLATGANSPPAPVLPAPDLSTATSLALGISSTNGRVALSRTTAALNDGGSPLASLCNDPNIADLVGYGTLAACYEGIDPAVGPTPNISNTTAAIRRLGGCQDSNNNRIDFVIGAPTPRNSLSPLNLTCGAAPAEVACCTSVGACAMSVGGSCTNGGTLGASGSTCTPNTCPQVTCCNAGACSTSTDGVCPVGSTASAIVQSSCTPNPCPQFACCLNGVCSATVDGVCQGGSTLASPSASGACTPQPCPQPLGACCSGAGTCTQTTGDDCPGSTVGSFGVPSAAFFQGVGSACTATNCGVCCRGATCVTNALTSAACTASLAGASAGASYVSNTACGGANHKVPCCYADYDKLNGKQVADIFAYLTDWFAHGAFAWNGAPGPGGAGNPPVSQIFAFLSDWFAGC